MNVLMAPTTEAEIERIRDRVRSGVGGYAPHVGSFNGALPENFAGKIARDALSGLRLSVIDVRLLLGEIDRLKKEAQSA